MTEEFYPIIGRTKQMAHNRKEAITEQEKETMIYVYNATYIDYQAFKRKRKRSPAMTQFGIECY